MLDAEGVLREVDVDEGRQVTAAQRGAMLRKDSKNLARFSEASFEHDGLTADAARALGDTVGGVADIAWHVSTDISMPIDGPDGHTHFVSSELAAIPDDPVHFAMKEQAEEIL